MEKKDIRKLVFERRAALSETEIQRASKQIAEQLFALKAYQEAKCIYLYMDCKKEASTREILLKAWREGKRTAVPKVEGEDLSFYYIEKWSDVAPGFFQVPEPVTGKKASEEDALLIMPGVAFDRERNRCGYGRGFYDRYLSRHKNHTSIAIALDIQMMDVVPSEETDIKPQMLLTPSGSYQ